MFVRAAVTGVGLARGRALHDDELSDSASLRVGDRGRHVAWSPATWNTRPVSQSAPCFRMYRSRTSRPGTFAQPASRSRSSIAASQAGLTAQDRVDGRAAPGVADDDGDVDAACREKPASSAGPAGPAPRPRPESPAASRPAPAARRRARPASRSASRASATLSKMPMRSYEDFRSTRRYRIRDAFLRPAAPTGGTPVLLDARSSSRAVVTMRPAMGAATLAP